MLPKICALAFLIAVNVDVLTGETCDVSQCPSIPKHYEELGCKAVKKAGACCTSSFDCPSLTGRDNSKCYFKDKVLAPGDVLEGFQQADTCEARCYCNLHRGGGPSEIYCSRLKCNEQLPVNQQVQYCLKQYDKQSCCPVKTVCDDDINKLATCEFEGRTYREGEKMYPKRHCYKCFCAKNFSNKTSVPDNKNCHKIDCGMALTKTLRLVEGCIPVYIKTDDCCPVGWRCPGDKHMAVGEPNTSAAKDKCRFGNMLLKVGEGLDLGGHNCQNCTCSAADASLHPNMLKHDSFA